MSRAKRKTWEFTGMASSAILLMNHTKTSVPVDAVLRVASLVGAKWPNQEEPMADGPLRWYRSANKPKHTVSGTAIADQLGLLFWGPMGRHIFQSHGVYGICFTQCGNIAWLEICQARRIDKKMERIGTVLQDWSDWWEERLKMMWTRCAPGTQSQSHTVGNPAARGA